jgi:hypothetical protein
MALLEICSKLEMPTRFIADHSTGGTGGGEMEIFNVTFIVFIESRVLSGIMLAFAVRLEGKQSMSIRSSHSQIQNDQSHL